MFKIIKSKKINESENVERKIISLVFVFLLLGAMFGQSYLISDRFSLGDLERRSDGGEIEIVEAGFGDVVGSIVEKVVCAFSFGKCDVDKDSKGEGVLLSPGGGGCPAPGESDFVAPIGYLKRYILDNRESAGYFTSSSSSILDLNPDSSFAQIYGTDFESLEERYATEKVTSVGAPNGFISCAMKSNNFGEFANSEEMKAAIGHYYNVMGSIRLGYLASLEAVAAIDVFNNAGNPGNPGSQSVLQGIDFDENNPFKSEMDNYIGYLDSNRPQIDAGKIIRETGDLLNTGVYGLEDKLLELKSQRDDKYYELILEGQSVPTNVEVMSAINLQVSELDKKIEDAENEINVIKSIVAPWTLGEEFQNSGGAMYGRINTQFQENRRALLEYMDELEEVVIEFNSAPYFRDAIAEREHYKQTHRRIENVLSKTAPARRLEFDRTQAMTGAEWEKYAANFYLELSDEKMKYVNRVSKAFWDDVNSPRSQIAMALALVATGWIAGPFASAATFFRAGSFASQASRGVLATRALFGLAMIGTDLAFSTQSVNEAHRMCTETFFDREIGESAQARMGYEPIADFGPTDVSDYKACVVASILAGVDVTLTVVPDVVGEFLAKADNLQTAVPGSLEYRRAVRASFIGDQIKGVGYVGPAKDYGEIVDFWSRLSRDLSALDKHKRLLDKVKGMLELKGMEEGVHFRMAFEPSGQWPAIEFLPNNDNALGIATDRARRVVINGEEGRVFFAPKPPSVSLTDLGGVNLGLNQYDSEYNSIFVGIAGLTDGFNSLGSLTPSLRHELRHAIIFDEWFNRGADPVMMADIVPTGILARSDVNLPPSAYRQFLSVEEFDTYITKTFPYLISETRNPGLIFSGKKSGEEIGAIWDLKLVTDTLRGGDSIPEGFIPQISLFRQMLDYSEDAYSRGKSSLNNLGTPVNSQFPGRYGEAVITFDEGVSINLMNLQSNSGQSIIQIKVTTPDETFTLFDVDSGFVSSVDDILSRGGSGQGDIDNLVNLIKNSGTDSFDELIGMVQSRKGYLNRLEPLVEQTQETMDSFMLAGGEGQAREFYKGLLARNIREMRDETARYLRELRNNGECGDFCLDNMFKLTDSSEPYVKSIISKVPRVEDIRPIGPDLSIETRYGEFLFDDHALGRMEERKLFPEVIRDTIDNGNRYRFREPMRFDGSGASTEVFIKPQTAIILRGSEGIGDRTIWLDRPVGSPKNLMVMVDDDNVVRTMYVNDDSYIIRFLRDRLPF